MRQNEINRNTNIELLRLIAAGLIVLGHFATKGGAAYIDMCSNKIIAEFVSIGGKLGVNIFIIISCYFMYDIRFKINRVLRVWLETLLYSVGITVVLLIFRVNSIRITGEELLKLSLPVFGEPYWYVSAYIAFIFLQPILQYVVHHLPEGIYRYLLFVLSVMLSIVPMIFIWSNDLFCSNLVWFAFMYLVISYLIRFKVLERISRKQLLLMVIVGISFIWTTMIIITLLGNRIVALHSLATEHFNYYSTMSLIPMLIIGIGFFGLFLKARPLFGELFRSLINYIAPSAFGIYLIHCHPLLKNDVIWELFDCPNWFYDRNIFFVLKMVGTIVVIIVASVIIDQLRIRLIEKPILNSKIYVKMCNRIDSIIYKYLYKNEIGCSK